MGRAIPSPLQFDQNIAVVKVTDFFSTAPAFFGEVLIKRAHHRWRSSFRLSSRCCTSQFAKYPPTAIQGVNYTFRVEFSIISSLSQMCSFMALNHSAAFIHGLEEEEVTFDPLALTFV